MSVATIGYLANLQSSTTQAGTYTNLVTEPLVVNVPPNSITKVPATHLQSPGNTKEYIPGMIDPQSASYEAHWIKGDYSTIKGYEGLVRWFKITSPDPDGAGAGTPQTYVFPGFITNIELGFNADDGSPNKINFDIEVTGATVVA